MITFYIGGYNPIEYTYLIVWLFRETLTTDIFSTEYGEIKKKKTNQNTCAIQLKWATA